MSDGNWNDLERLWQSLPPQAAPAAEELRRLHRWRWASLALIGGEILMTLVGLAAAVWLLTRHNTFTVLLGVATLVIVVAAAGLSWWARSLGQVRMEDPVAQAVAIAVRRARVGVRLAVGTQWAICMGLLFTALVAFGRSLGGDFSVASTNMAFMAVAYTQVWMALCLAATIVYHRKRSADLARLEALAASLAE
jgi:hypothetical protein